MEVDRTPAENLAYQVGWTTLVLKWENDEQAGLPVKTPSDGFKWNQLGELYQWFTDTYAHLSLKELMGMLDDNIQKIFTMIDSMTEEELFLPHKRKWADEATKTAKRSNYICNELFTWADVYDTANHDERRAILQQFIKEIRVRKDYEISITLNASFNQVEQLKAVSTYDGAEIFEEISEKGA